jgi:lactate permease
MTSVWLQTGTILLPFIIAILLLIVFRWKADTTGFIMWIFMAIFALTLFKTDFWVVILSSVAGFVASYPISLMVLTSIFMITYMEKTGALQRIIIAFKTLGGEGKKPFQIMFINIGLGCFLVSIGATPVTMLPPIMAAIGYSPLAAVALPAIGYDPLCTFALLAIPAVVFQGTISNLFASIGLANFPTIAQSGFIFSVFMPVVTMGIAFGMLYIAGGKKLLFKKESVLFAVVGGAVAGGTTLLVNFLARTFAIDSLVYITGVIAGLATCGAMLLLAKIMGYTIFDRNNLTEEDKQIEKSMPLWKAFLPWIILIVLCIITNFIPPVYVFLFETLAMPVKISGAAAIKLRVFWNAWFLVIIATVLSMPFLGVKKQLKDTFQTWSKRSIRPVFAAGIFFAVAYVMNYSGATGFIDGSGNWIINQSNNMITAIATVSEQVLGQFYPIIVPFIGLLGGFVSGSETSAIAMFTKYQFQTGSLLGLANNSIVVLGAANGIGGGLASVLSPAKIQNAAAVIDKQGIEGEVIKQTAPIALLMVISVSVITLCWANEYSLLLWFAVIGVAIAAVLLVTLIWLGITRRQTRKNNKDNTETKKKQEEKEG